MRKYYYYTYKTCGAMGGGIAYSDNGEFDLFDTMEFLAKKFNENAVVTFWQEISSQQYEKMRKYFDSQNK